MKKKILKRIEELQKENLQLTNGHLILINITIIGELKNLIK